MFKNLKYVCSWIVFLLAFATVSINAFAQDGGEVQLGDVQTNYSELSLKKVNSVIKKLLKDTFVSDELIGGIVLRLDPEKTDIDAGSIAASLTAKVKSTPWLVGSPALLSLKLDIDESPVKNKSKKVDEDDVDLSLETELVAVEGRFAGEIQTKDALALVKFIAKSLSVELEKPENSPTLSPETITNLKAVVTDLEDLRSYNQLKDDIYAIRDILLNDESLKGDERKFLKSLRISSVETENQTTAIKIESTYIQDFGDSLGGSFVAKDFGLHITKAPKKNQSDRVELFATMKAEVPKDMVEMAKTALKKDLLLIQEKNEALLADISSLAVTYANYVKEFLKNFESK